MQTAQVNVESNSLEIKYSICITNYNTASTLEKSISSILAQMEESYEIVVVDNFSQDGSESILKTLSTQGRIRASSGEM